jgi:protein-disulfide isomerase
MAKRSQVPRRAGRSQTRDAFPRRPSRSRWLLWVVIGAVVLIVAGLVALQAQSIRQMPEAQGVVGERTMWGPEDATVQIVNYSNFACGHCRNFALNQGRQLREEYEATGLVSFEFKHFRLSDASATEAAAASECAADQGRFWDYHDRLFSQLGVARDPFARSALKQYAAQLDLDTAQFDQCLDRSGYMDKVYRDSQEGRAQGVEGTPTFFINGEMIVGDIPYDQFKTRIDAALNSRS